MAISYVSEVIKSNPWIQPFDLGLMMKVNTYKQGEFYKNAQKADNMITQLNNADIANPEQRDYLKQKVNNLTLQLNNMGAINYSDANIANSIEGFGADIYQDDTVLNGIGSTKMLREWQANVQKLKSDPKLNKYYNGANEAWDYEKYIKPYVSGGIHAKYEGPRSPKPYTGNPFTKVMGLVKDLRPDIETRIDPVTGNKFFFSKTEKKYLSQEDISAAVDGFIDGDTKQQLQIDAWYNYDYSTGNSFSKGQGMEIYTQDIDNVIANKNTELARINEQLAVEPDINKKADLETYKKAVADNIKDFTQKRGEYINKFGKEWDDNPTVAKYKLYMNRFQKDILKAGGYTETKTSLIKNEERLFQARQQLEYTKNGLHWGSDEAGNLLYNHDGTPHVVPVAGAESMVKKDKTTAATTAKTVVDLSDGIFHDIIPNTETTSEAEKNRVTEQSLKNDNKTIDDEMTKKLRSFIETTAKRGGYSDAEGGKKPVIEYKTIPESNKAAAATISVSPLIDTIQKIGADDLLDRSDIQYVLDRVGQQEAHVPQGMHKDAFTIQDDSGQQIGVTKEQVGFFRKMLANWDAVATGQLKADEAPINVSPSDMTSFVNNYQTLNLVKGSNTAYISNVKSQAMQGLGLSAKKQERYKYFLDNADQQGTLQFSGSDEFGNAINTYVENKEWTALKKEGKLDYSTVDKRISDAFKNASNRLNYYSMYLPDVDTLKKVAPGLMAKIQSHSAVNNGNTEQITPTAIHRDGEQFKVSYIYGKGDEAKTGEVDMDSVEALKLGAQLYPNQPLEKLLTYETTSGPLYTYSTAFKQPIKYSIEREGNDRNQRVFIPYVYFGDTKIPVFAPDKTGFQASANAADALIKNYITNNPTATIEEFIQGLKTLAYNR